MGSHYDRWTGLEGVLMFELDVNLPERLRPMAWLIGRWEGAGVLGYPTIESKHYGQEIHCWHDGRHFLQWEARAWILDSENGARVRPAAIETGFWRPGEDGSEVELLLTHPTGILEMYYGQMEPAKITLRTDSVMRSPHAKEYNAATRLYGLVEGNMMYTMDMAAVGQPLQPHLSAQLKRVG
ncbi:MAG: FABP family protein [Candidatus Phosphoribacter baldrii]|nr:FABP family protein [Dermatophilaceae bacterium]